MNVSLEWYEINKQLTASDILYYFEKLSHISIDHKIIYAHITKDREDLNFFIHMGCTDTKELLQYGIEAYT